MPDFEALQNEDGFKKKMVEYVTLIQEVVEKDHLFDVASINRLQLEIYGRHINANGRRRKIIDDLLLLTDRQIETVKNGWLYCYALED